MYDDQTYSSFKEQNQHNALSDDEYELMPATRNYFDFPDLLQHEGSDTAGADNTDLGDGKFHDVKAEFLVLPEESTNMFEPPPFEGGHKIEGSHRNGAKISASTLDDEERTFFKMDKGSDKDDGSTADEDGSGSGASESSGSGDKTNVVQYDPFATPKAAAVAPPKPQPEAGSPLIEPKPHSTSVKFMLNGTKITQFNTGIKDNKGTKTAGWKYIPGDTMPGFQDTKEKNAAGYKHLSRPGEETEQNVERKEEEYKKAKKAQDTTVHHPTSSAAKVAPTHMYLVDVRPFHLGPNKSHHKSHSRKLSARNLTSTLHQRHFVRNTSSSIDSTPETSSPTLHRKGHTYRIYNSSGGALNHHRHHHSKKHHHQKPAIDSAITENTQNAVPNSNVQNTSSPNNNNGATPISSPLALNNDNNHGDESDDFYQKPQKNFANSLTPNSNISASNVTSGAPSNMKITDFTADVDVETPDQDSKPDQNSNPVVNGTTTGSAPQIADDGSGSDTENEGSGNEAPSTAEGGKKPERVVPVGLANATEEQQKPTNSQPTKSSTSSNNSTPTKNSGSSNNATPTKTSGNSSNASENETNSKAGNNSKTNEGQTVGSEAIIPSSEAIIPEAANEKESASSSPSSCKYILC